MSGKTTSTGTRQWRARVAAVAAGACCAVAALAAPAVGRTVPAGMPPPDGATAYVADHDSASVTPIDTATEVAGTPIPVGSGPSAIAITP